MGRALALRPRSQKARGIYHVNTLVPQGGGGKSERCSHVVQNETGECDDVGVVQGLALALLHRDVYYTTTCCWNIQHLILSREQSPAWHKKITWYAGENFHTQ